MILCECVVYVQNGGAACARRSHQVHKSVMLEESETIYCDICAQNGKTNSLRLLCFILWKDYLTTTLQSLVLVSLVTENLWMECDDLKSPVTSYKLSKPDIPASQIHVVMWEIQKCDAISNPSYLQKIISESTETLPMAKCNTKSPFAAKSKTESSVVQSNLVSH
ncbi:hypothetical protein KUTeg_000762 [Tegillarca granosa]|uniref:Ubiquitin-specific peptidase-like SUMO isopeptidase domain-containing protein n=1 Tax=Tegillarca granosa TaxID=220873 RepID=A0ABQ9FZS6_TEGGR|nr:hypothetical protein KUTeg_000762 [Tegillarca granosa]